METGLIYYVSALIGVIVHFAMKIWDAETQHIVFEWKKHLIVTGLMTFFALVLVFFKPSIVSILTPAFPSVVGFIEFPLTWAGVGYCADSLIKNAIKTGEAKLKISETDQPQGDVK
jgi:hypothetical protein